MSSITQKSFYNKKNLISEWYVFFVAFNPIWQADRTTLYICKDKVKINVQVKVRPLYAWVGRKRDKFKSLYTYGYKIFSLY